MIWTRYINFASLEFSFGWPECRCFHHLRVLSKARKPVSSVHSSYQTHWPLLPAGRRRLLYIRLFKKRNFICKSIIISRLFVKKVRRTFCVSVQFLYKIYFLARGGSQCFQNKLHTADRMKETLI